MVMEQGEKSDDTLCLFRAGTALCFFVYIRTVLQHRCPGLVFSIVKPMPCRWYANHRIMIPTVTFRVIQYTTSIFELLELY